MFNKKEIVTSGGGAHSVLSVGAFIKGEIKTDTDIRIDGTLEGNVTCKGKVIIGVEGTVKGNLDCANVELVGKIYGNVLVHGIFSLRSTSFFKGEAKVKVLEIESGAQFFGVCDMLDEKRRIPEPAAKENEKLAV